MGALDPYGMQGGEFQQNPQQLIMDNYNQNPMANDPQMVNPKMAAYASALSNIGDIIGGRGPRSNIASTYMNAKGQNDKIRQNRAALMRQREQDELNRRYRESQIYKNEMGGSAGGKIGTINPRDFTAESVAKYQQTGDINSLVRYAPKVVDIGGIQHRENTETGKWEPIVDLNSPDYLAQIDRQVKLKQEEQSALDFTAEQSKWQSGEVNYLNNINGSEQKLDVINDTAAEIKNLVSGWTTGGGGLLNKLPGSDSRKLAGLLDTIKANSAFTTLTELKAAGGTLGAISEAELNLLERAWGALDQGGDPAELLRVLDQLVSQNAGSLQRLRYGYDENSKRYGTNLVNDQSLPISKSTGDNKAARLAELRSKHGG
jgi:hypothetical protein